MCLLESCVTTSVSSTQTIAMGDAMNNQNRYSEAIQYYESYLRDSPSLGLYRNYELESDVYRKLAHVNSTQGRYSNAIDQLQKAYEIDSEINKNNLRAAEDLRQLGLTYSYTGDYQSATNYLRQSLAATSGMEASAKSEQKLAVADTYLSLASVELALGNIQLALTNTELALAIYGKLPNEYVGKVEAFLITAQALTVVFELEKAEAAVEESRAIAEAHQMNTARHLQAESEISRLKGDLEGSLRKRLGALEEAEKSNITPQIAWAQLRVGDAYNDLSDGKSASTFYRRAQLLQQRSGTDTSSLQPSIQLRLGDIEQARNVWGKSGFSLGVGIANLKLGQQLFASGQTDSAFFYFSESGAVFADASNTEGLIMSNLGLSQCHIQKREYQMALSLLNETIRLNGQAGHQPDAQWQLWFQKGLAFDGLNKTDSAIHAYFLSIDIIEGIRGSITIEEFRSSFFEDKTIVYDQLIQSILRKGVEVNYRGRKVPAGELAFIFNERARSRTFLDMLGNKKVPPRKSVDNALLEREQSLRLKIQLLGQQIQRNELSGKDESAIQAELENTQKEYEEVVQRVKLANPAYAGMVSLDPPQLPDVQSKLNKETVLIEYWVGKEQVVAWVIGNGLFRYKLLETNQAQLKNDIKALRNSIKFNLQSEIDNRLASLHSQLIAPLYEWIQPYDNIGIIPHSSLHFLPFQALVDETGAYLIADKNLFFNPSAAIYYLSSNSKGENGKMLSVALGNHIIGAHKALPGTQFEINQISQFYQQYTPRYGEGNSEDYFKENAHQYNLIHVATHGVLSDKQPLYSYLLMSASEQEDGRLTVNEIMDMKLSSKLVTLSACETALGDLNNGDELVGLSRAFLYAGTEAVIVSLWTVDDLSTSLLMTKFHQFLSEDYSPAQALGMAQRAMLKQEFQLSDSRGVKLKWENRLEEEVGVANRFRSSPYYWAPFVLIGNGN
ncbi:MAG: CHAT domain-containing protein [Imperialibacter sp.]|uniref:CHAT domain-containing protein n=1 Tax=Imperialibacter sp. TaxID=2038411 RepID=UPI0032EF09B6